MISEEVCYQKVAVFPTDEQGRMEIAKFQQHNRVCSIMTGEMVNNEKKEPCLWIIYIPGLDPYMEQKQTSEVEDNDRNTTIVPKQSPKTKRTAVSKRSTGD